MDALVLYAAFPYTSSDYRSGPERPEIGCITGAQTAASQVVDPTAVYTVWGDLEEKGARRPFSELLGIEGKALHRTVVNNQASRNTVGHLDAPS